MDGGGRVRERDLFVIWVTEKMAADWNHGNKEMMEVEDESSEDFDAISGTKTTKVNFLLKKYIILPTPSEGLRVVSPLLLGQFFFYQS